MNEKQQKLSDLIGRVEKHQEALRLSNYKFATRFQRHVGSGKTWQDRLRARNWPEIAGSLDKWLVKLTRFVAEIDSASTVGDLYESLPIFEYCETLYDILQGQRNDRRAGWIVGPTGIGKSESLKALCARPKSNSRYLSLLPEMVQSPRTLSLALVRLLGCSEQKSTQKNVEACIEHLKGQPCTIMIDDVQEGGVLLLKLIKALIDHSQVRFILAPYPTGFNRLISGSTDAMAENQQLLGRSIKPICRTWMKGLNGTDIAAYLSAACGLDKKAILPASQSMTDRVRKGGNLRMLADVVELARMNADESGADLTIEYVEAALETLSPEERQGARQ